MSSLMPASQEKPTRRPNLVTAMNFSATCALTLGYGASSGTSSRALRPPRRSMRRFGLKFRTVVRDAKFDQNEGSSS
jgi:hypothetical protein